jgi:hypothetical protein
MAVTRFAFRIPRPCNKMGLPPLSAARPCIVNHNSFARAIVFFYLEPGLMTIRIGLVEATFPYNARNWCVEIAFFWIFRPVDRQDFHRKKPLAAQDLA